MHNNTKPLYKVARVSRHPQLGTRGFCCSKVLLLVCPWSSPLATGAFGL